MWPLTVGHATNDELRNIDDAVDADKINATGDVRRFVVVAVIPGCQRNGIDALSPQPRSTEAAVLP